MKTRRYRQAAKLLYGAAALVLAAAGILLCATGAKQDDILCYRCGLTKSTQSCLGWQWSQSETTGELTRLRQAHLGTAPCPSDGHAWGPLRGAQRVFDRSSVIVTTCASEENAVRYLKLVEELAVASTANDARLVGELSSLRTFATECVDTVLDHGHFRDEEGWDAFFKTVRRTEMNTQLDSVLRRWELRTFKMPRESPSNSSAGSDR